MPPPVLCYSLAVPDPRQNADPHYYGHDAQRTKDASLVDGHQADLSRVLRVVRAIALSVVVNVEHHGD